MTSSAKLSAASRCFASRDSKASFRKVRNRCGPVLDAAHATCQLTDRYQAYVGMKFGSQSPSYFSCQRIQKRWALGNSAWYTRNKSNTSGPSRFHTDHVI